MIAENINLSKQEILDQPQIANNALRRSIEKNSIAEIKPITENGKALIYIINYAKGGFLVLSAERKETPILAYSEENYFATDTFYAGIKEWKNSRVDRIKEIRKTGINPDSTSIKEIWKFLTTTFAGGNNFRANALFGCGSVDPVRLAVGNEPAPTSTRVGPLLKTRWRQGCTFNTLCDVIIGAPNCNRAVAGCVPVAMAQIMRYHKKPTTYNWLSMPDTIGIYETARLISDAGKSLPSLKYGATETGANSEDVRAALINSFNYGPVMSYTTFDPHRVVSNLALGFPVYLRGEDKAKGNGHAWVCDGYLSNKYCTFSTLSLSMNWGWGGISNGWYWYDNWNPSGLSFNYSPKMLIDIKPRN